jgi:Cyclin, N-terminal domain
MDGSISNHFPGVRLVTMEETVATISAMCHQEVTGYFAVDYIHQNKHRSLDVDQDCRKKMVAWSYQVVDFCKFNRETVEIAMSYLDRFLSTPPGRHTLQDRSVYQLAAMASLYTAVKIHEPEAMDPTLVSNLSRGTYSPKEIEEMEFIIIQALQWRLNPPTTLSFVREFYNLIPYEAIDGVTRTIVYELTKFQAELAASATEFVGISSSEKAYCCFINAMECLALDPKIIQYIAIIVKDAIGITSKNESKIFVNAQSYLYSAVSRHPILKTAAGTQSPKPQPRQRSNVSVSPRSSILQIDS